MASITKFAAINTKVRALEGKFLTKDDYENLINFSTQEQISNYLRTETAYKELFESIKDEDIGVAELETVFRKYVFNQYEKLIHYFTDENRKLFKILFMRYEVENLKFFIRAAHRQEDLTKLLDKIMISEVFSKINYVELSHAKSLGELINLLKGTAYYEVLKPYVDEESKKILFYMEMNLDRLYFQSLYKQINKLKGEDHAFNNEVLGINIDILNLEWIYRGLKYYGLSPEELFNYCLKGGFYINMRKIKELCYINNDHELIEVMKTTKYASLFMDLENLDKVLEKNMEEYLYKRFLRLMKKSDFNLITPIGFMHKLEYEMRDLFSIIEAKRYNLGKEETKKFLIRYLGG